MSDELKRSAPDVDALNAMTLMQLQYEAHECSVAHGWYDNGPINVGEKLALIHSEISEALEAYRNGQKPDTMYLTNGKPEGFRVELADAVIRIMDLCQALHINLQNMVTVKMQYNESRPYRHGGKVC